MHDKISTEATMDNALTPPITDALGREIVIGEWYGYSRNDSGFSHTTVGRVLKIIPGDGQYKPPKVRLTDCYIKRYLYGMPTDYRLAEKPKDVTIASYMVFPVA